MEDLVSKFLKILVLKSHSKVCGSGHVVFCCPRVTRAVTPAVSWCWRRIMDRTGHTSVTKFSLCPYSYASILQHQYQYEMFTLTSHYMETIIHRFIDRFKYYLIIGQQLVLETQITSQVFSCEDAGLQVLMYVCPSVRVVNLKF